MSTSVVNVYFVKPFFSQKKNTSKKCHNLIKSEIGNSSKVSNISKKSKVYL